MSVLVYRGDCHSEDFGRTRRIRGYYEVQVGFKPFCVLLSSFIITDQSEKKALERHEPDLAALLSTSKQPDLVIMCEQKGPVYLNELCTTTVR